MNRHLVPHSLQFRSFRNHCVVNNERAFSLCRNFYFVSGESYIVDLDLFVNVKAIGNKNVNAVAT